MDTRRYCGADGERASANYGSRRASTDLRREIPAAGRCASEVDGVQQGLGLGPTADHREGRLGNSARNRYPQFGSCYRLRRTAWPPAVGVRTVGEMKLIMLDDCALPLPTAAPSVPPDGDDYWTWRVRSRDRPARPATRCLARTAPARTRGHSIPGSRTWAKGCPFPQRCREAGFDGAHDPALAAAQMASMGLTVSGTVATEDIRHLQSAAHRQMSGPIEMAASPQQSGPAPPARNAQQRGGPCVEPRHRRR